MHTSTPWAIATSFLLLTTALVWVDAASADEGLRERFLTEAPKGWAKIEAAAKEMQGSGTMSQVVDHSKTNEPDTRTEWTFKLAGDLLLYEQVRSSGNDNPVVSAGGVNSKYFFFLKKNVQADSWLVGQVETNKDDKIGPAHISRLGGFLTYFLSSCSLFGTPLAELINDPAFRVKKIDSVAGSDSLVAVQFDYKSPETPSNDPRKRSILQVLRGGQLVLDSKHHWAIHQCKVSYAARDYSSEYAIEYDVQKGTIPIVKSYRETTTRAKLGTHTVDVDFDVVPRTIPESEFTLSAYGLPEPMGVEWPEPPSRAYIWLFVGALGALVTGLAFRRLAHRLRPSTA